MTGWKLAVACLAFFACAHTPVLAVQERYEFVEPHMGTLFRIALYASEPASAKAAARAAFDRISALNRIMSDYDPASELMRLCREPAGTAVPVSAELFDILQRCQFLAEKTHGAFDVTLGPVIRLWRESRRTHALPTAEVLTAAQHACGFAHLHLDPTARTVTLLRAGMLLDLGGIAKGYAADEALAILSQCGFPSAMVAASGDLAFGDAPPGKLGWTVEIAPFGAAAGAPLTLVLAHAAVSTSGDAEQFVEISSVRYSHIVDPTTGLGLTKPIAVTVVARHATLTDGLDNTCSVLDSGAAQRLAETWPESVRVILHHRNADGSLARTAFGRAPVGLISPP
jgi:thiamine biosynthesis lipoprotein